METRIFIATQGKNETGIRLYEKLEKSGVKVRLDEGTQQLSDEEIEEKISKCSYFIPVIDRRLGEAHLLKLINWAIEYRKPIIPITTKGFSFPASIKKLNSCPNVESNGNDFSEVFKKLTSMIPDLNSSTHKTIMPLHIPEVLENSTTPRDSVNFVDPYHTNGNKNIEIGLSIIEKYRWPLLLLLLALLVLGGFLGQKQNVVIYSPTTRESVEPVEEHSKKKHSVNFSYSSGNNSTNVQQSIVSGDGNVVQQQMTTQAVNVNGNSQVYQYSVQQMSNAFNDYDYDRDYDYDCRYDW